MQRVFAMLLERQNAFLSELVAVVVFWVCVCHPPLICMCNACLCRLDPMYLLRVSVSCCVPVDSIDVGASSAPHRTVLMEAAKFGRLQCLTVLVDNYSADVNAQVGCVGRPSQPARMIRSLACACCECRATLWLCWAGFCAGRTLRLHGSHRRGLRAETGMRAVSSEPWR
jgi:hypothetical protein